jgi:hypothetical protein
MVNEKIFGEIGLIIKLFYHCGGQFELNGFLLTSISTSNPQSFDLASYQESNLAAHSGDDAYSLYRSYNVGDRILNNSDAKNYNPEFDKVSFRARSRGVWTPWTEISCGY